MTVWGWLKLLLMDFECSALSLPPVLEASHPISMYVLCLQLAGSCSPVYQLTHNQVESYLNLGTAPLTSWIWSITVQTPLSNATTHMAENRNYLPSISSSNFSDIFFLPTTPQHSAISRLLVQLPASRCTVCVTAGTIQRKRRFLSRGEMV